MRQVAIDLYSGCGGMSAGAAAAIPDLEVRWALDINSQATETFKAAHPEAVVDCRDVSEVSAPDIIRRSGIDKIDWFFAGPTCQAVSTMGIFHLDDPRNALFVHFIRLLDGFTIAGCRPANIVMENVPGVVYGRNLVIVKELFRLFRDRGYNVFADVVNMADHGLPQLRNRFILVATDRSIPPTFPKPTHGLDGEGGLCPYVSVAEAIGDLFGERPSGVARCSNAVMETEFHKFVADTAGHVANHHCPNLSEINRRRVSTVPQGGCWKDIPPELLPERFRRVRLTDYATLYGRLHEDSPAYTISAGFSNVTSGCFTHPIHDRPLTVREGARLQGFRDSFEFFGSKHAQYRQVGNAVPPFFMRKLVEHISSGKDGVQARITAEVMERGAKLPPMVRRFMGRKNDSERSIGGYGGGTYWPAGWGEPIAADQIAANGYRLADTPVRYRRRDEWRAARDSFRNHDLSALFETSVPPPLEDGAYRFALARSGNLDAIDSAVVRMLGCISRMKRSLLVHSDVRYLRSRIGLLHAGLSDAGASNLPDVEIDEEGHVRIGNAKSGRLVPAQLFFDDPAADAVEGEPGLVLMMTPLQGLPAGGAERRKTPR